MIGSDKGHTSHSLSSRRVRAPRLGSCGRSSPQPSDSPCSTKRCVRVCVNVFVFVFACACVCVRSLCVCVWVCVCVLSDKAHTSHSLSSLRARAPRLGSCGRSSPQRSGSPCSTKRCVCVRACVCVCLCVGVHVSCSVHVLTVTVACRVPLPRFRRREIDTFFLIWALCALIHHSNPPYPPPSPKTEPPNMRCHWRARDQPRGDKPHLPGPCARGL